MKRFTIPLVVVATVIILIFTGCAQAAAPATSAEKPTPTADNPIAGLAIKPDGTSYKFVHAPCFLHAEFTNVCDGVVTSLVKRAGGECTTNDPNGDISKQVAIVEDATVTKPDGIMLGPLDSAALIPSVEAAADAGIPTFVYSVDTTTAKRQTFVTHEQVDLGRQIGLWLVEKAKANNEPIVAYELWGLMGMSATQLRHQGLHEAADANPQWLTIIESPETGFQDEVAMNTISEIMPAHPEIKAIVSQGAMVQGTVQALRVLDMLHPADDPDHIYFFTIAMGPSDVTACRSGYLDGATCQSPWEQLDLSTKVMLDYCCLGNSVPHDIIITPYMIDQSNLDSPRYGAPSGWGSMYGLSYDLWPVLDFSEAGITSRGEDLLLLDGVAGGYDTPVAD